MAIDGHSVNRFQPTTGSEEQKIHKNSFKKSSRKSRRNKGLNAKHRLSEYYNVLQTAKCKHKQNNDNGFLSSYIICYKLKGRGTILMFFLFNRALVFVFRNFVSVEKEINTNFKYCPSHNLRAFYHLF